MNNSSNHSDDTINIVVDEHGMDINDNVNGGKWEEVRIV